jgi:predicted MPP superfamily phosphohydrolase
VLRRILIFLVIAQTILFLGHWAIYDTWLRFGLFSGATPATLSGIRIAMLVLSLSFVSTSLLAFRFPGIVIRVAYTIAAAWMGIANYFLFAALSCWIVLGVTRLAGVHCDPRWIAFALFGAALAISAYGIANAAWTRVTRISVKLPNLPESWRGRVAALVADTHLGHVRNVRFMRRIVRTLAQLRPDVVFIAGDLYDGTACDPARVAKPLSELRAPLGTYFITGNHEEFRDRQKYLDAVESAGVRVLRNEKVIVDDLQLIGVLDRESANANKGGYREILRRAAIDRNRASILLLHNPHALAIAEAEGVTLQLSGHTHGGQFAPWTWLTSRIYGPYVHGLQRFGKMMVFTTWGAGTWGPPLRIGTNPEVVLITFE